MTDEDYRASLIEAALAYAERGWPVHAIIDGKGRTIGYEERDGVRWGSTTDPAKIEAWARRSFVKIGIPTGERSGLLVIDVDDEAAWATLCSKNLAPEPLTLTSRTGREGGRHLVFEYPAGETLGNARGALPSGVDVRGEGGQFVAAPSRHEDGRTYEWIDPEACVSPLPGWLLDVLKAGDTYEPPDVNYTGAPATKWGAAALAAEVARIENAPDGEGNAALYLAACKVWEIVNGGHVSPEQAQREIEFAAMGNGRRDLTETRRTIESARKKTAGHARGPAVTTTPTAAPTEPGNPADIDVRDLFERDGLVVPRLVRLVEQGTRIRRGHDEQLWRYVDGVYRPDGVSFIEGSVKEILGDKWKKRHPAEVIAYFEAGLPEVGVEQPEHVLNVANGLLDWRTGELHPHTPDVLSTIQLPIAWNPDAKCPTIERFFEQVVPDAVEFMFEVFGYAAYPRLHIHKALLLFGSGRNGKGTTQRLLEAFVGEKNRANVPLQTFGERVFAAALLFAKLVNIAGDLDARDMARSDTFKMLTGGDSVYAEHKYMKPFSFTSFALLVFAANEAPISRDQSEGYFSRWLVVPFTQKYEGRAADTNLDAKLQTPSELEGLLVRAVHGLRSLIARGYFEEPGSVSDAGTAYRTKLDSVAGFVDDECALAFDFQVNRSDLYRRYDTWSRDNGRRPLNSATFFEHLRNRYEIADKRTKNGRFLVGIKLGQITAGTL